MYVLLVDNKNYIIIIIIIINNIQNIDDNHTKTTNLPNSNLIMNK